MKILILLLVVIALTGCMPKRETYILMPSPYPSAMPSQEFKTGYQVGYQEGYKDAELQKNYK